MEAEALFCQAPPENRLLPIRHMPWLRVVVAEWFEFWSCEHNWSPARDTEVIAGPRGGLKGFHGVES